jgi:SAM-dependent methyltransferase
MSDSLQTRDDAWKRDRWEQYYAVTAGRPPRETLLRALDLFAAEDAGAGADAGGQRAVGPGTAPRGRVRRAIDLGCGAGNDVLELLRRGWLVLATDELAVSVARLLERIPAPDRGRLETQVGRFAAIQIPAVDLVNASYSLPFAPPPEFEATWRRIVAALPPGGRFAGHFFGVRDSWASNPDLTFHTIDTARDLLREFEVEHFFERDEDGETALGEPKHWHAFEVVARKV